MPKYDFECNSCKEKFEVSLSMKDRESAKVVCSKCKSSDTTQIYSSVNINIKSSAKSGPEGCCGRCSHCG